MKLLLLLVLILLVTSLFAQRSHDSSIIKRFQNITAKLTKAFIKTIKRSPEASVSVYSVDTSEVSGNRLITDICGVKLFKRKLEIYIAPSKRHEAVDLQMHEGIIPWFKLNRENNALCIPHNTTLDQSVIPSTVIDLKLYDLKFKVQFIKGKLLRLPMIKSIP
jgi:hypothetical protein